VKISTLRISFRRYNYKFGFLLDFFAALSGVPCSMEYSVRDNELICSEENLSWLNKCFECWTTLEEIKRKLQCPRSMQIFGSTMRFDWNSYGCFIETVVSILRVTRCLLQMFRCKFIILFNDSGAQIDIKITYSSKLSHSRDLFTIAKVSSRTTKHIYKRKQ